MPGSPLAYDEDLNPLVVENFKKNWNLDSTLTEKYFETTKNFFSGNFGYSFYNTDVTVESLIADAAPKSLIVFIMVFCLFICFVLFGYWLFYIFLKQYKKLFYQILWIISSWPAFFIAPLAIYIFSYSLNLFSLSEKDLKFYLFISLVLVLKPTAHFLLLMLDKTNELEKSPLFQGLCARGLSPLQIYLKHFFKISVLVFFSKLPQLIFHFVVGSFFIESLFSLAGLGDLYFSSVLNRDYPVSVSLTFLYGVFFISLSFLSEYILNFLDPRLREV